MALFKFMVEVEVGADTLPDAIRTFREWTDAADVVGDQGEEAVCWTLTRTLEEDDEGDCVVEVSPARVELAERSYRQAQAPADREALDALASKVRRGIVTDPDVRAAVESTGRRIS